MHERRCPACGRIYSEEDWQEETCPFCDVALEAPSNTTQLLEDTLSLDLSWPPGEREVMIGKASGYLEGQILKAALEAAGIPVLLQGATVAGAYGFTVGDMGAVRILVPVSRAEEARSILNQTEQ
jgi:hypothetical protein